MVESSSRGLNLVGKDFGKRNLGSEFLDSVESSKILKTPSDLVSQKDGIYFLFYVMTSTSTRSNEASCSVREGVVRLQSFQRHQEDFFSSTEKSESIWTDSPFIIDFSKNIKSSRKRNSKKQRYQISYSLRDTWTEKNTILLVSRKICKSVQEIPTCGVIRGEESFWEASLLRLCMQVSGNIFGSKNKLQEMFSSYPQKVLKRYDDFSKNIEKILQQESPSEHFLRELGSILIESGLFSKYEDRFLDLIQLTEKLKNP